MPFGNCIHYRLCKAIRQSHRFECDLAIIAQATDKVASCTLLIEVSEGLIFVILLVGVGIKAIQ